MAERKNANAETGLKMRADQAFSCMSEAVLQAEEALDALLAAKADQICCFILNPHLGETRPAREDIGEFLNSMLFFIDSIAVIRRMLRRRMYDMARLEQWENETMEWSKQAPDSPSLNRTGCPQFSHSAVKLINAIVKFIEWEVREVSGWGSALRAAQHTGLICALPELLAGAAWANHHRRKEDTVYSDGLMQEWSSRLKRAIMPSLIQYEDQRFRVREALFQLECLINGSARAADEQKRPASPPFIRNGVFGRH
ncbi:hypothetical protein [Paenibacillus sp. HW567]|uniref:hypothetical protein n=1 Tax=Paenibacillus sp. HW567 TaxID=1034769 RepID=UPI00037E07DB|nr:hypothetical protein [Paenibacillus sp. HW567]